VRNIFKYCQNCGAKLRENAKFCESCGVKIPEIETKKSIDELEKEIREKIEKEFREKQEREYLIQKEKELRKEKKQQFRTRLNKKDIAFLISFSTVLSMIFIIITLITATNIKPELGFAYTNITRHFGFPLTWLSILYYISGTSITQTVNQPNFLNLIFDFLIMTLIFFTLSYVSEIIVMKNRKKIA
jgi:hypothetical protein